MNTPGENDSTIIFEVWNITSPVPSNQSDIYDYTDDYILFENVWYFYGVLLLLFFCIVSVLVNVKILICAWWIKQPLSPTLHISLSLAGADAFSGITLGLGLIVNSLIPISLKVEIIGIGCMVLCLEAIRLAGVMISMSHLFGLAVNHYLGIIRPLHYASIMTRRMTISLIAVLWIFPLSFFLSYFALIADEGFQSEYCATNDFLFKTKFRTMFSSLLFIPFIIMVFIYVHIFIIVRKHQASRLRFSQAGSSFHRNGSPKQNPTSQQMATNLKAIYTTLFILGSFLVGWMPATLLFVLICEDCWLDFDCMSGPTTVVVYNISNLLIILKTLVNPIIYAARMHEIQVASRRMFSACRSMGLRRLAKKKSVSASKSSDNSSNIRFSQ